VPLEFGHLERGTRGDLCPEDGYRAQSRVSILGTLKINEFALKEREAEVALASMKQSILPLPETLQRISGTTPGCEIGGKMR
jgi:hypothetical protein